MAVLENRSGQAQTAVLTLALPEKVRLTAFPCPPPSAVSAEERSRSEEETLGAAKACGWQVVVPFDDWVVRLESNRVVNGKCVFLPAHESVVIRWQMFAGKAITGDWSLTVSTGQSSARADIRVSFLPPVLFRQLDYIPEPVPVKTEVLVGAHHCPLWEADKVNLWANVLKHPERTPALGFYAQENPEVSDWETKWAVEHGVSFFIYCWYRASQGGAVKTRYGTAIHDALFKSRFADKMKFTIMWENQSKGVAGVADERDLFENLMPYWIDNYFKHPSYLKIGNRPLLFIYRPEFLVKDLGSVENVRAAFGKMRQACREAGFDGLVLLGEYRGLDPKHLAQMKDLGLDYTFAYCWGIPNSPEPQQAVQTQLAYIRKTQELGILPQVVTVSQAWSGWRDEGSIWKIPPADFEGLLREAKAFIATLPPEQLGRRMLLLDNWNEWGEGHYLAPYREYGFGYLDAVRNVFAPDAGPHEDLLPQDIGLGPYDTAYRRAAAAQAVLDARRTRTVTKPGADEPGLIGWWAFDESAEESVTLDYSGHGLGGVLEKAGREAGVDGPALVCLGGSVMIAPDPSLSPSNAFTVSCWVKTDVAEQKHVWFINRIFGGSTSSGFRLGLQDGRPCFGVPVTSFSHHLTGKVMLPVGRWVHLAGTFDGQTMRLYMDGAEQGALARPGALRPNDKPLCLGNYDAGHAAHFTGLLDEVKLYGRALSADEIREAARRGR
ncbi:MAG TPA: glycoside hydrolase family 99-like domain-containing protein [Kiritimatiellia bacterium]|nr:glycoside hydrolase family 99-like domain-containing protein [Kiritimatiellia bacterium]HPS08200.1 glycoside hydrolase family 99-like domain-containing protein [Kiritimatiellia bacterium]